MDELVYGAREAAWTLIRDDLSLSYSQVGLLITIPTLVANLLEPAFGILADAGRRRTLILGGGVCYALGALLVALSPGFPPLMLAFVLLAPASGAFVSLSQGALMDGGPDQHEQNMARWNFAGSVGVVAGPLALGGVILLGGGWRGLFAAFAVPAGFLCLIAGRLPRSHWNYASPAEGVAASLRAALTAIRQREIWRWLILLEFSDMMLDILLGYLALYMMDVVGATPQQAALVVAVWSGVGLAGDYLLIGLLKRVRGLAYLRVSAALVLALYPAFLVVPGLWPKAAVLGLLGLLNSGWYPILQGQVYASLPGRSGAALALGNFAGMFGGLIPLVLGLVAERFDLRIAMWLLVAGPVALLVGIPRTRGHRAPNQ